MTRQGGGVDGVPSERHNRRVDSDIRPGSPGRTFFVGMSGWRPESALIFPMMGFTVGKLFLLGRGAPKKRREDPL